MAQLWGAVSVTTTDRWRSAPGRSTGRWRAGGYASAVA